MAEIGALHAQTNIVSLANKAFVAHWKEKGAHFDGKQSMSKENIQPLLQLEDINTTSNGGSSIMDFPAYSTLKRYDFGADLVTQLGHLDLSIYARKSLSTSQQGPQSLPPVVMSAAIGYSLEHFKTFVGSLRKHYFGDVFLLISKEFLSSDDRDDDDHDESTTNGDNGESDTTEESEAVLIRRYLDMHNVYYLETHMGRSGDLTTGSGWEKIGKLENAAPIFL